MLRMKSESSTDSSFKLQILIQDKRFMKFRTKCLRYSSARSARQYWEGISMVSRLKRAPPNSGYLKYLPQYLYTIIYIHHLYWKDYGLAGYKFRCQRARLPASISMYSHIFKTSTLLFFTFKLIHGYVYKWIWTSSSELSKHHCKSLLARLTWQVAANQEKMRLFEFVRRITTSKSNWLSTVVEKFKTISFILQKMLKWHAVLKLGKGILCTA